MNRGEKAQLVRNIARFVQCVECKNNPKECGCTEKDEDENGYCMQWESWMTGRKYGE